MNDRQGQMHCLLCQRLCSPSCRRQHGRVLSLTARSPLCPSKNRTPQKDRREDSGSHSPARPGLGLLSTLPVHGGAQAEKEESPSLEKRGKKGILEDTA